MTLTETVFSGEMLVFSWLCASLCSSTFPLGQRWSMAVVSFLSFIGISSPLGGLVEGVPGSHQWVPSHWATAEAA